jgi:hypothetical protein
MVSARGFMVALATVAMVGAGAHAASAGQAGAGQDNQLRAGSSAKFERMIRTGSGRVAGSSQGAGESQRSAAPPSVAVSTSAPAASAPAAPAAPVAAAPAPVVQIPVAQPGLSATAPEKAPAIIGGGGGPSRQAPRPTAAATPEPSTLLLMGAGIAGLYRLRRRK